jgi:hypothetical protein
MRKSSAVTAIQQSGFELVPKRKTRGKLATERDLAKLTWTPWKPEEDGKLQPSDLLADHGVGMCAQRQGRQVSGRPRHAEN